MYGLEGIIRFAWSQKALCEFVLPERQYLICVVPKALLYWCDIEGIIWVVSNVFLDLYDFSYVIYMASRILFKLRDLEGYYVYSYCFKCNVWFVGFKCIIWFCDFNYMIWIVSKELFGLYGLKGITWSMLLIDLCSLKAVTWFVWPRRHYLICMVSKILLDLYDFSYAIYVASKALFDLLDLKRYYVSSCCLQAIVWFMWLQMHYLIGVTLIIWFV